jgi:tetratricopeptide (TPR) repeat protein
MLRRCAMLALSLAAVRALDVEAARAEARSAVEGGQLHVARSKLKKAIAHLREAEAKPSERIADVLSDLGNVYARLGQESEAVGALEEAADVTATVHGRGDARYSVALDRLADAHARAGEPASALTLFRGLLETMRARGGTSHPGYRVTLGKLAKAAMAAGKPRAATKAFAELLELAAADGERREAAEPTEFEAIASMRVQYARALAGVDRLDDALQQATLARDAYARTDGLAGSLEHAASLNGLAGVLERLGRDDEAVAAMEAAHAVARDAPGAEPAHVQQAERNVAGLKRHVLRKRSRRAADAEPKGEL